MTKRSRRLPFAAALAIWVALVFGTAAVELGLQNREIRRCQAKVETARGSKECVDKHRSWTKAIGQAIGVGILGSPLPGRYFIGPDRLPDRLRRAGAPVALPLHEPRTRRRFHRVATGLLGGFFLGFALLSVWFATTPADAFLRAVLVAAMAGSWGAFALCLGVLIAWRFRYGTAPGTREGDRV